MKQAFLLSIFFLAQLAWSHEVILTTRAVVDPKDPGAFYFDLCEAFLEPIDQPDPKLTIIDSSCERVEGPSLRPAHIQFLKEEYLQKQEALRTKASRVAAQQQAMGFASKTVPVATGFLAFAAILLAAASLAGLGVIILAKLTGAGLAAIAVTILAVNGAAHLELHKDTGYKFESLLAALTPGEYGQLKIDLARLNWQAKYNQESIVQIETLSGIVPRKNDNDYELTRREAEKMVKAAIRSVHERYYQQIDRTMPRMMVP